MIHMKKLTEPCLMSASLCFSGCLCRFQLLLWSCYLLPGLPVSSITSSLTTQQW